MSAAASLKIEGKKPSANMTAASGSANRLASTRGSIRPMALRAANANKTVVTRLEYKKERKDQIFDPVDEWNFDILQRMNNRKLQNFHFLEAEKAEGNRDRKQVGRRDNRMAG
ncbi:hypothetical protein OMP40_04960 [Cohnella rhizosphaerae]|uniref:Uncharacterized protein n=1 Tax=Cohnella rhizosphaerae TaxID=1457232 RepID=A0A9X4KU26_9BACL|nr:hypothetical protein [Cohnella rhizosphaerae]MDG0808809.1 hypothetical protein [Cohnella rhizosphaerae]